MKLNWVDLQNENAALSVVLLDGKQKDQKAQVLVVTGDLSQEQINELKTRFQFIQRPMVNSTSVLASIKYTNKNLKLNVREIPINEFLEVFPNAEVRDMEVEEISRIWSGLARSSQKSIYSAMNSAKTRRALESYESIGLNEHNIEIFLSNSGDRFYHYDNDTYFAPREGLPEYLEYHFDSEISLRSRDALSAAKALLLELDDGRIVDQNRLDQVLETSFNPPRLTSKVAKEVQAEITDTMRALLSSDQRVGLNKATINLEKLQSINDQFNYLPIADRSEQTRESLSPAYAYIVRKYLEGVDNCSQLSVINDTALTAANLTPNALPMKHYVLASAHNINNKVFSEQFGALHTQTIEFNNNFRVSGKQILFNANIGTLDSPKTIDGVTTDRKDHAELLLTLSGMENEAGGVFVIGTDDSYQLGSVNLGSMSLHNYIYQNYNVLESMDIASVVMGDHNPLSSKRVYVIQGRKTVPSSTAAPSTIEALYTIDDVYHNSNQLLEKFTDELTVSNLLSSQELEATTSISDILANYQANQSAASKYNLNFAQAPYTPLTSLAKVNDTAAMPRNFVHAAREAAIKLVKDVGNPDQFLINELGLSKEHIVEVFDAEQIDAITMGIWRLKNNKPFLNGDATGKGKGRVLAALMYWQVKQGRTAMFFTSTPDLLNDIWRDIRETKLESKFEPLFVLGKTSEIIDKATNEVLINRSDITKKLDHHLKNDIHKPAGNLVLCTYTQIKGLKQASRKNQTLESRMNDKARWLLNVAKNNDTALFADESHNIASVTSNQAAVINHIADHCSQPVTRSSATWAKDGKNIAQCADMFPDHINAETLTKMISRGGTGLQEVLSTTLKAEGAFVRREHNFGKRQVNIITSTQVQRNKQATNALAEVMTLTREYTRVQFEAIKRLSRFNQNHKNIEEFGFASTFSLISEAFTNSLRAEQAVKSVTEAMANKKKPILGIDKTGGTALKYLFDSLAQEGQKQVVVEEMPDFKVALFRWLENEGARRITEKVPPTQAEILAAAKNNTIAKPTRVQHVVKWRNELPASSSTYQELEQLEKDIEALIRKMPNLPLSPVDYIKDELSKVDISISEVTGRALHVRRHEDGERYVIEARKGETKAEAQFNFNTNKTDAIIVSRSGTEGISLHSHEGLAKYGEEATYARDMMLMGQFFNIVDEEQYFGRGERKGEGAKAATYSKIITGMPVEARLLALSERNRLRLSASTTGNAQSLKATQSVPNFLNNFGNETVAEYLYENVDLMETLGFEEHVKDAIINHGTDAKRNNQVSNLAGSVLGKMMLLGYDQQLQLLDDLTQYYNAKLSALQAKGLDPLNTGLINGEVHVSKEAVLQGKIRPTYESEFDKPILVQDVVVQYPPIQITPEMIEHEIKIGSQGRNAQDFALDMIAKRDELLERELNDHNRSASFFNRDRYYNVTEALNAKEQNKVKRAQANFSDIQELLNSVKLGHVYSTPSSKSNWIITEINLPPHTKDALELYRYEVVARDSLLGTVRRGFGKSILESFGGVDAIRAADMGKYHADHAVNEDLRHAQLNGATEKMVLLTGNIINAAVLNSEHLLGRQVTIKDTATGGFYPAIQLKPEFTMQKILKKNFSATNDLDNDLMINFIQARLAGNHIYEYMHASSKPSDGTKKTGQIIFDKSCSTFVVNLPKTKTGRMGMHDEHLFDGLAISKSKIHQKTNVASTYKFKADDFAEVLAVFSEYDFHLSLSAHRIDSIAEALSKLANTNQKTSDIEDQVDIEEYIEDAVLAQESSEELDHYVASPSPTDRSSSSPTDSILPESNASTADDELLASMNAISNESETITSKNETTVASNTNVVTELTELSRNRDQNNMKNSTSMLAEFDIDDNAESEMEALFAELNNNTGSTFTP